MDAQQLLQELLNSGRQLAEKGLDMAEDVLNVPESGPQRDAKLDGLKKGAMIAGGLALLLGTRGGRQLTGTAIKLGSIGALGGLAYQAFKRWQKGDQSVDKLQGSEADKRSRQILKAMIAAAKADGHIDAEEQRKIEEELVALQLAPEMAEFLREEMHKPLDMADVVEGVDSPQAAAELYVASRIMVGNQSPEEKAYLQRLAQALGLTAEQVSALENELSKPDAA
ncbi:tellurite resistance TerB family protein [Thiolapillus sp.]